MIFETHILQSPLSNYIESLFYFKNFQPQHSIERAVPTGHLFIIFELNGLIKVIKTFGSDVTITPKKTSVSIIRKKQFALIKQATKTRTDLGLKLKDVPTTNRLENSGPFGTMCTHRVKLENNEQVDSELINWLQEAYNKAD